MVNVVIAGGCGNLGRELVEELRKQGKHDITVLSRSPPRGDEGINVVKVDYNDKNQLIQVLKDAHTVIDFVMDFNDATPHYNLINASVEAGVKRFAPPEWAAKSYCGWDQYKWKDPIKEYLESINKDKKVLEYCLFQPGYIMDYLLFPKIKFEYMMPTSVGYDVESGNAIMTDGGDNYRVWTTLKDFVNVVSKAIDYEGVWPKRGGIQGDRIQPKEVIRLIQKYNPEPIKVHQLNSKDLEKGEYKADWIPTVQHPAFMAMLNSDFVKGFVCQFETANVKHGALDVSDEWNKILSDYHFTSFEELCKETL